MRSMSYSFPITGHLYKWWGGPPGPRPTTSSACSGLDETDLLGKERVQGDPRGPGVRPTIYAGFPVSGKLYEHWARMPVLQDRNILQQCTQELFARGVDEKVPTLELAPHERGGGLVAPCFHVLCGDVRIRASSIRENRKRKRRF